MPTAGKTAAERWFRQDTVEQTQAAQVTGPRQDHRLTLTLATLRRRAQVLLTGVCVCEILIRLGSKEGNCFLLFVSLFYDNSLSQ